MTSTPTARDEMLALFRVAWEANSPALNGGTAPRIYWQRNEVAEADKPQSDEAWARVTVQHNEAGQRTLGQTGNRRFDRVGVITVQVFTSQKEDPDGSVLEALGIIARDAFEGNTTSSDVWFRNVRLQETDPDDPWWQLNVLADFSYDDIK